MHQYHFDIIVLGESRASSVAATLLAKSGKKVLTFQDGQAAEGPWLFSSLHLNRILEQLDGREGLGTPSRLQVITDRSRLEFHGRHGLANELRREFPGCHNQLISLLRTLETLGQRLENQLWAAGGPPLFDFVEQLRFARRLLLSKSRWFGLRRPLSEFFDEINDVSAYTCFAALFSGLAMAPFKQITVAEGALLWSSLCQPQEISATTLDDLLRRRYKQFHGGYKQLASVEEIDGNGQVHLKNAKTCSADIIIIGNLEAIAYLADKRTPCWSSSPYRWRTTPLKPGVSSLLAPRIILNGEYILRTTFTSSAEGAIGTAECCLCQNNEPPPAQEIKTKLARILPFVSFDVGGPIPAAPPAATSGKAHPQKVIAFPGTARRLRLKNQALPCIGAEALPHLGSVGEIMTGVSVANYLLRKNKVRI